jgi:hypothetical protein
MDVALDSGKLLARRASRVQSGVSEMPYALGLWRRQSAFAQCKYKSTYLPVRAVVLSVD